jgi:hypothetical protein
MIDIGFPAIEIFIAYIVIKVFEDISYNFVKGSKVESNSKTDAANKKRV